MRVTRIRTTIDEADIDIPWGVIEETDAEGMMHERKALSRPSLAHSTLRNVTDWKTSSSETHYAIHAEDKSGCTVFSLGDKDA